MTHRDPTCSTIQQETATLFDSLLRLEESPWPDTTEVYAEHLARLAAHAEHPCAVAWLYQWGLREFGRLFMHRDAARAECRLDALADLVVAAPALFLRLRARLGRARRPNLRSMLRARLLWCARALYRSRHGRHDERTRAWVTDPALAAAQRRDPVVRMMLHRLIDQLILDGDPASRALLLIAAGHSVAEAARRTGVSRQSIYRFRAEVLDTWRDDDI